MNGVVELGGIVYYYLVVVVKLWDGFEFVFGDQMCGIFFDFVVF